MKWVTRTLCQTSILGMETEIKKKQVVLTSPPKSVGMHSAHRAAAIFPFPTRCLVTGPLHRASLSPPRHFSRFHPSGRGRAVMSTQAMQACLPAWPERTVRPNVHAQQASKLVVVDGIGGLLIGQRTFPFLPACLSFSKHSPN